MHFGRWVFGILAAVLLTGCITPPTPPRIKRNNPGAKPDTGPFWWGISSSAFQTEDRGEKPGSPNYFKTDWDLFAEAGRVPPKGDDATFSWSQFDKDLEALKKIGVNHYRFGVEWARIEPHPGQYNEAALRRYVDFARKLKAAGIEPVVTLWHFTFPDWMVVKGKPGRSRWLSPYYRERWPLFVDKVTRAMSPYVRTYVPQNEPNGDLALGYISSVWPPGMFLDFNMHARALTQSTWGFREAAKIIKQNRKDALVMAVVALPYWIRTFWDPTSAYYNFMQRINFAHLDRTYDVCDLIGFNYYYTEYADFTALLALKARRGRNYSLLGWVIQPHSLYKQINIVAKRYGKPIVITENGIATSRDIKRVRYLFNHMLEVKEAMADGADVRGYFVWTLVDNYEWHHGYKAPFGLSRMDPVTKRRLLRPSALFYKGLISTSEESSMLDEISSQPELPQGFIER
ncbi:MAG: glycoside hydrolase family 1 protein [Verrucomicrobia bacterium]|nr:glycoside hydrolase family 1 protein [Verrucomicrobiota bacterium]